VESNPPPRRCGRGALMGRFFGNVIVRRRVRIYPARGRGWRGWEGNRHQPKKSPSNSVGARAGWGGGVDLYGRPRPVPCTHLWGNAITLPPPCIPPRAPPLQPGPCKPSPTCLKLADMGLAPARLLLFLPLATLVWKCHFQCRIGKPGTGERNVGRRLIPSEPT